MKRILFFLLSLAFPGILFSQTILERYQKAEQFLPKNSVKLTRNVSLQFNEVGVTKDFWYKLQTKNGEKYYYFNGENKSAEEAFDHDKLALSLAVFLEKEVNPDLLNLQWLTFKPKDNKIEFIYDRKFLQVDLTNYITSKKTSEKRFPKNRSESPDKKWLVEVKDYNLILKNTETGEETQLTTDGVEKYEYATELSWYNLVDISQKDQYDPSIFVNWSSDSKKFMTYRLDRRKVGNLYLYQSLPDSGFRAKVWSYERALPGEDPITTEYYIFDVDSKSKVRVDVEPFADFLSSVFPNWFRNNNELYFSRFRRGYKAIDLYRVNAETGETYLILTDSSKTMVESQLINCKWLKDGSEFFWTSERDGWNHIYHYTGNGKLLNRVTTGEYVVHEIVKVDEKSKRLYFIAGGREPNIDPYYKFLYSVKFDGTDLTLLTKEPTNHEIWFPLAGDYFVDSYSDVTHPTIHVVRDINDGTIIYSLAEANIDALLAAGWKYPEPFKVKARDGVTDIYGAIYYPSTFNPSKKYAVLDNSYSGPQLVKTPKSFEEGYKNYDISFAELGFIVITIDGLGTAWRSKAFHDVSYQNLGDIGAEDHIAGMNQLAKTRSWMDLDRVGIYGHSAGGYDAAHAMFTHPEFYKAAVSSAGNHDHRIAKAWWPEQYMGMPGKHYDEQSNFNLAGNLQGKLLLIHGDMDNNVNAASSLRLAAKLIEANKDFELLIIPNRDHGLADHPYFIRKRWDWFVKNLTGEEPPKEYEIKSYK
ncbi:MAG: prolyl oligopeptidase family serine peptidase [Draconibacterium sp.]